MQSFDIDETITITYAWTAWRKTGKTRIGYDARGVPGIRYQWYYSMAFVRSSLRGSPTGAMAQVITQNQNRTCWEI